MPGTTWPVNGYPPGSSRTIHMLRFRCQPSLFRHVNGYDTRLPDPHLTHQVRLLPHRSPRQSSANAAVGGLEPAPAGRLRGANPHLLRSTASRSSTYIQLLLTFVTHVDQG